MNSNNIFLTLQFLEVHLNGRKYSPKPSIYYWARLVCINVLFSFRVTGKKWTELVQTVRVLVPNFRCLGDDCLTHPAVTDMRAISAHLSENMGFPTAVSMPLTGPPASLRVLIPVDGKRRLHHDLQMKMFPKHCLQDEMWLHRYLREDNPRPCFINYSTVYVIKEASRILYSHSKALFKAHFISSHAGKLNFLKHNLDIQLLEFDTQFSFYRNYFSTDFRKYYNYPEWNKHVFLSVSEMFYFTNKS